MRLTGGEIIAEYLIRARVPYAFVIPGHGCLGLVDAFLGRQNRIKLIQVKQEMAGVHMADAYYRVTGRPLAVITSIGPGAVNTAIGAASAYVDSIPVLIITGGAHTYLRGKGLLQEIARDHDADFPRMLQPVVKRYWRVDTVRQLPGIIHRAFNLMLCGRRGPVLIDLPMDVQCDAANVRLPEPATRAPTGRVLGDPAEIERAAKLLYSAQRPVILAGGGVAAAGAQAELKKLAELLGAAVITTLMGKGTFAEDHPLYAWHAGSKGTTCGNLLASRADVLLAVGCRFTDETSSSFRHGVSFAIPPTKLIHVDLDPAEIGKNYPVAAGIVGDAKAVLRALHHELSNALRYRDYMRQPYFAEILALKEKWLNHVRKLQASNRVPVTISRGLKEIRQVLRPDAFVVTSSGNVQAQVLQEFPFHVPGTCVSAGGFSTMGYSVPGALGVKLAHPRRQVAALVGDGDFLMSMQEMSTAMQYGLNAVLVVFNNCGWLAIKDLQMEAYGPDRAFATDFLDQRGRVYTPNFQRAAQAFGLWAEQVSRPRQIQPALRRALQAKKPALLEIMVNREYPYSGSPAMGWWDVPVPAYLKERRRKYERARKGEKL